MTIKWSKDQIRIKKGSRKDILFKKNFFEFNNENYSVSIRFRRMLGECRAAVPLYTPLKIIMELAIRFLLYRFIFHIRF